MSTTSRGYGAVGSAPDWQCGGQGFESPERHFLISRVMRSSRAGQPFSDPGGQSTPISSQMGGMMMNAPRGVQNGVPGGGPAGGGGGAKTGAGASARIQLSIESPFSATIFTLPWPDATVYHVWHTFMSHRIMGNGSACPGHQLSACATPAPSVRPAAATAPAAEIGRAHV